MEILHLICPVCGLDNPVVKGKIIAIKCQKCGEKIFIKKPEPPKPVESTTVKEPEPEPKPIEQKTVKSTTVKKPKGKGKATKRRGR